MVIAQFVPDEKHDQKAAAHADGETEDIYKREGGAFSKISDGDKQVVPDHDFKIVLYFYVADQFFKSGVYRGLAVDNPGLNLDVFGVEGGV
jgi:hypothetical protein